MRILLGLISEPSDVVNDRGKVGGSPQLHCPQGGVVGLNDTRNANTIGIGGIAIERKLMGHLTTDFTTESKSRKQFVTGGNEKAR